MSTDTTSIVALANIQPSQTNPRKTFRTEGLDELAASIKKYGVLQPILIRPQSALPDDQPYYEIIAGERRYRASKLAAMLTIPARIVDVSDMDVLELQIIENLQREDLHPLEEAESYEALLKQHANDPDYSVEEVSSKLGKSKAYVYARMKLCALQPKAREAFYADKLTASTALLLARIPVPALQDKALGEITAEDWHGNGMSFRRAADHIQSNYMLRLDQAKFKISDATLVPEAGPCTTCPKRTGANPDLFSDVGRADVCTDPICFGQKKAAHAERIRIAATESGKTVITGKAAEKIKPHSYGDYKGYLKPDESPWWIPDNKSIKKTLRAAMPDTVLIEDPHSGEMVELVPEDKVRDALKAAGIKVSRASTESSATQRANDAKAKAERTYLRAVLTAIHLKAAARLDAGQPLDIEDLRVIASHAYRNLAHDLLPTVAGLWAWPVQDRSASDAIVAQLSANELALLLLDTALASDTYVNGYNLQYNTHDRLSAAAARFDIDLKAIRKANTPQIKPKKVAKKTTKAATPTAIPVPVATPETAPPPVPPEPRDIDLAHPTLKPSAPFEATQLAEAHHEAI